MYLFQDWCEHGNPTSFWLSSFFFPCGFLSAVILNFSRKHNVPVLQLDFDFIVCLENNTIQSPDDGILVYGLFIEGARLDAIQYVYSTK